MNDPAITLEELIAWKDLLTEEERMVRQSVHRFAEERCMPLIAEAFEAGRFPDALIPEIAALGILGADIKGYECAGMSPVAYGLACHEIEACDSGLRSFVSVQTSLSMYAICRFGSEEQRRRWLPPMARGEIIGCFGLTEPNHGSDPGGMATRARRDGKDWVITGNKMWITNAQIAGVAIVWARTEEGPRGIEGFLVERGMKGFEAPGIPHKLSMRASHTGSLVLDEVRVPEASRLPEARGLSSALACLNNARFGVGWGVLGAARRCFDVALAYTRERTQFGAPLATRQLIQARLAEMADGIAKGSLLALHVGRLKEQGRAHHAHVSLMKRNNCRMALDVARKARALLGANGITTDYEVIRHALNLESTYTYEGTDEMHTLILGRALTGHAAF